MPPSLPDPSKLFRILTETAVRLLRSSRPVLDPEAAPAHPSGLAASEPASRAKRSGKHDQRLLDAVERRPGATVAQAAQEIGVHPTALYPVIRRLEARGQLLKRGRELHLTRVAATAGTPAIERLWCEGGHWWHRPPSRGPKPRRCPEHRRP